MGSWLIGKFRDAGEYAFADGTPGPGSVLEVGVVQDPAQIWLRITKCGEDRYEQPPFTLSAASQKALVQLLSLGSHAQCAISDAQDDCEDDPIWSQGARITRE